MYESLCVCMFLLVCVDDSVNVCVCLCVSVCVCVCFCSLFACVNHVLYRAIACFFSCVQRVHIPNSFTPHYYYVASYTMYVKNLHDRLPPAQEFVWVLTLRQKNSNGQFCN